ncbi:arginine repressor [Mesobacillus maritimus]|uniref:arginine repressor n=1 Tax=Mesobacillus maritimus TaxID=1643336 RepID=UPI00204049C5|nr:arginine repressor [Mesobacillus maritimus]MCM3588225.1 arginine repressor [Mesobacillus maritimus]
MRKEMRIKLIKELIASHEIKTQNELVSLLVEKGYDVTQATVSRDFKNLKLMKVPCKNGGFKYSTEAVDEYYSLEKLQRKVRDAMISIEEIHYFVLIKTFPGHAQSFGVILDGMEIDGKAGTICGNDTCLIICRTPEHAMSLRAMLESLR